MAISKEEFTDTEGKIRLTNGDFEALKKAAQDYGLSDESDVIAFALGVLSHAEGRAVITENSDGRFVKFAPADKLKTKEQ